MKKSLIKTRRRFVKQSNIFRLETGFSMLEAVVVVGVLLALAVGGFFAYGPIVENAKIAKVRSAASEVHTGVVVADIDGDSTTSPQGVIDDWNNSNDKIRVEILEPEAAPAAMTTAALQGDNGDFCVQATNVASPHIKARSGACVNVPGGSGSTDETPNGDGVSGGTDPMNEDIDGDGIPNGSDSDVDGDGIANGTDPDIDGDGIPNETDDTPNGYVSGPTYKTALGGAAVDPRVEITGGKIIDGNAEITISFDNAGMPTNTGPYWGYSARITCQLPDGSQYHEYRGLWSSYDGDTAPVITFPLPCPSDGSVAVGYIAGPYAGAPELTEPISGINGPINVISQGLISPFTGNQASVASATTFTDPRVSLRKASITADGLVVGVNLDLGGAPFNSNPYYGLSNRLTCKLADESTFYTYPSLYTSYNGNSYPAPNHTFKCPTGATVVGYVAGGDAGAHELEGRSGQRGPINVLRGGQNDLSGNDASIEPASQSYSDPRVSVRKVTLSGGTDVSVGLSLNLAGVSTSGAYYNFSARLTCENLSTGAKSYKATGLYTSYTNSTYPAPSFNISCPAGTKAVGYVVGPYNGTPELTVSPGAGGGPKNVVIGGIQ